MNRIPLIEIEFTYARSSGPGGQNVNKVNSKVILRWNIDRSTALSPVIKERVRTFLQNRLTLSGDLIITSDRFRDQIKNRADCLEKFEALIHAASQIQTPRKKTRPTRGSVRRKADSKKRNSQLKGNRAKISVR